MKVALIHCDPDRMRGCQALRLAWESLIKEKWPTADITYINPMNPPVVNPDLAIAVGGDTPSYLSNSVKEWQLNYTKENNIRTLGGGLCFSQKNNYEMITDYKLYNKYKHLSAISVRDTRSFNICTQNGLTPILRADPSYILQPQSTNIETIESFIEDNSCIGINLMHIPADSLDSWKAFITELVTTNKVILIPCRYPEDIKLHSKLNIESNNLLEIKSLLNYTQIKHVVSKCKTLIASSTHITLAGYHTSTPTLAIGYSAKAFALDSDIFLPEESCCISNEQSADLNTLQAAYNDIETRTDAIAETLSSQNFEESAHANIDIFDNIQTV